MSCTPSSSVVSVQIRAESVPVPLQQDPRWGVAVAWPVIVNQTELSHGPGPETVGHVAALQHAPHMLLRDPDCTLTGSASLHGVVDEVVQQLLQVQFQPSGGCPPCRKSSSANLPMLFVSGANLTLHSGAPASASGTGGGGSAVAAAN
eukprot:1746176-Rhodomonas_salina.2